MTKIKKIEIDKNIPVYDISLDGTFVNALGGNVVSNTDGFNFQIAEKLRYTEENPYISNGNGRNSIKGKAYVGIDADVCEFEDMFFAKPWNNGIMKMGLGIDEFCDACIQFKRKNYADLMPDGKMKFVGNTIKSRKMAGYQEKFMDMSLKLLLHNEGDKFLTLYYDYIDDIFNYRIPIKDIASKGNIKKTIEEYKRDCNTLTKAGSKKSRQAWYELAIQAGLSPNMGETIYYLNTGSGKSQSDVKRITHQYVNKNNEEVELNAKLTRELLTPECEKRGILYKNLKTKDKKDMLKKYIVREEDEIILNCKIVPADIMASEDVVLCSDVDGLEYNVEKYIEQFNSRLKGLLVVFSPEIRDKILIKDPKDRKYFTIEESKLVNGQPINEADQDKYEVLMTPERKEVDYWLKMKEIPPFTEECDIDWNKLAEDAKKLQIEEDNALFQSENNRYLEAIENLTNEEYDAFEDEGKIPESLNSIVRLDIDTMRFVFKNVPGFKNPSTGGFIYDDLLREKVKCH